MEKPCPEEGNFQKTSTEGLSTIINSDAWPVKDIAWNEAAGMGRIPNRVILWNDQTPFVNCTCGKFPSILDLKFHGRDWQVMETDTVQDGKIYLLAAFYDARVKDGGVIRIQAGLKVIFVHNH